MDRSAEIFRVLADAGIISGPTGHSAATATGDKAGKSQIDKAMTQSRLTLGKIGDTEMGPLLALRVHGNEAIALWETLRALVDQTGHWPVVLGSTDDTERVLEGFEYAEETPASESIAAGEALDVADWIDEQPGPESDSEGAEETEMAGDDGAPTPDEKIEGAPPAQFTVPFDILTREPHSEVTVALVPTRISYHVPALLHWGGWNDCPAPEHHVALLKHWKATHGAELVAMSSDVIELKVARPPTSPTEAEPLAREQYAYCYDIVEQGCGSIEALARALTQSGSWYFWWD